VVHTTAHIIRAAIHIIRAVHLIIHQDHLIHTAQEATAATVRTAVTAEDLPAADAAGALARLFQ
jgi:hypothetical protein